LAVLLQCPDHDSAGAGASEREEIHNYGTACFGLAQRLKKS
jgi:hypothetical protein